MSIADITHPAELVTALNRLGLETMLETYIDPRPVRAAGYHAVNGLAQRHGYTLRHEDGNIYGRLTLVPDAKTAPYSSASSPGRITPPSTAPADAPPQPPARAPELGAHFFETMRGRYYDRIHPHR